MLCRLSSSAPAAARASRRWRRARQSAAAHRLRAPSVARRSPSAEVSPDTPALTTSSAMPASCSFLCSTAGYACSRGRPRPAVRLSPRRRCGAPVRRVRWVRWVRWGARTAVAPELRGAAERRLDPPHEIAASTRRQRRTRFNLLYLTVVYSRPWSPSPFSRRWRARARPSNAAVMRMRSASSRRP